MIMKPEQKRLIDNLCHECNFGYKSDISVDRIIAIARLGDKTITDDDAKTLREYIIGEYYY